MTDRPIPNLDPVFGRILREVMPEMFNRREPRYMYFERGQTMYCWTTERMSDGTFRAFIYRPYGKGARTGTASKWRLTKEVKVKQRKIAKGQARRWYERSA